jgi:HlyD family secretion protein
MVPNAALRFKPVDAPETKAEATPPAAAAPPAAAGEQGRPGEGKGRGKKRETGSGTVYIIEKGEIKGVTIQLGITDNRNTEVVGGDLKAGDKVIVGENPANASGKPSSVGVRLF